MAKELTPRQLRFVTEYMQSGIASRAYALAGYRPTTRNALDVSASQLLRTPKIKREIARRKAAMIKRADVTLDKLLQDLADDRELARRLEQPSAAIAAVQLTAKLCGLLIERKESGQPGDFSAAKTPDEVIAAVRAELGDEAAALVARMTGEADGAALSTAPAASESIN
jgi:terminase small subunit-like protein